MNLKILNRFDVTQDDGFDAVESGKVRVTRAIAVSKDDNFSAKTWPYKTGTTVPYPYPPRPLSNVFFDDCLGWSDCHGYKIGQGVWQDQDTVAFQNSVVYTAAVGMGKNTEPARSLQDMNIVQTDFSEGIEVSWP